MKPHELLRQAALILCIEWITALLCQLKRVAQLAQMAQFHPSTRKNPLQSSACVYANL
jgi:hypothetical protein